MGCKYCQEPVYKQNRCEKHYRNMLSLQAGSRAQAQAKAAETKSDRVRKLREQGYGMIEASRMDDFQQLRAQTLRADTVMQLRQVVLSLISIMEKR